MLKYVFTIVAITSLSGVCSEQQLSGIDNTSGIPTIMKILSNAGLSGSLEYSGNCTGGIDDFPKFKAPGNYDRRPLSALSEMFATDSKIQVTQAFDRTIRIKDSDVPEDIIDVTISRILFKADPGRDGLHALDNPGSALWFILRAPEVTDFMRTADISFEHNTVALSMTFSPRSEHILGELREVTLGQALNYMLKTFPGLWVYKNCPATTSRKRQVFFEVYSNGGGWAAENRKRSRP